MITTYQDTLKYLYDNLPMFQRVGAVAIRKDLTNTFALCEALGNPQRTFRTIHVAGTNGKGSTSHMLASVLQTAGYKTGLYTSPHLKDFTERIKVNGIEADKGYVVEFVNRMLPVIEAVKPSFFEITVAMAFDYFAREAVDVAVIEVGLGGRLDSTNVISPLISVITNISWDHQDLLGNTLPDIAAEKAGIIKPGVPVVISERQAEVEEVFIRKAGEQRAPISFASDEYSVRVHKDGETLDILKGNTTVQEQVGLPLHGYYQHRNVVGVMKALDILQVHFSLSAQHIREGLEGVVANTRLKGRWQTLRNSPTVICDTGHNYSGVGEVMRQIRARDFRRLFILWGMVKDKDVKKVLSLLPADAIYYFCQARIPRAMEAARLQELAVEYGLKGEVIPDVNEALRAALAHASPDDLIFIGGSTYVVAEIDEL